ncbi:MAG: 50S ribosomal protein L9 [Candidatus Pacebacteria bacterium]|nr:50S ribosomal protein L9 [Candidatus Paceibacterota bacterium]
MKVVLIKDTPKVGKKYDVKEVAAGYAENFLFPKDLAKPATPAFLARIKVERKQIEAEQKVHEDLLLKNIKDIAEIHITLEEKANEKGHLFAGVHKEEISKAIKEQTHLDILPDFIDLEHPIKEVGEHIITVKAHDKEQAFKLTINPIIEK